MKLGITTKVFEKDLEDRNVTLREIVEFSRQSGIQAVELREECVEDYEEERLKKLASEYKDLTFTYATNNNCLDEEDEQKVKGAVDLASTLSDIPILRLLAAGGIIKRERRRYSSIEKDEIAEKLSRYSSYASKKGVALGLENAREPMEDIKEIIDKVSSLSLGVTFDPGNLTSISIEQGDPFQALGILEPSEIKIVHLKQTIKGEPQNTVCDGDIDIKRLLDELSKKGYNGIICLEPRSGKNSESAIKRSIEYMNNLYGGFCPYF